MDLYGAFASHYKLAANRPQGTARVRVFTPTTAEHGWSADGHSVVEVVVDDMPFLVDSLTMELSRGLHDVHAVVHPLLDVTRACQTCHRFPEAELKARVEAIQDRTKALMDRAEDAIVDLINNLDAAKKAGVDEAKLKPIYELQRKAQWRVDFVNAENSMGFHAPQEAARILGEAIDFGRQGQIALRDLGVAKVAKK